MRWSVRFVGSHGGCTLELRHQLGPAGKSGEPALVERLEEIPAHVFVTGVLCSIIEQSFTREHGRGGGERRAAF